MFKSRREPHVPFSPPTPDPATVSVCVCVCTTAQPSVYRTTCGVCALKVLTQEPQQESHGAVTSRGQKTPNSSHMCRVVQGSTIATPPPLRMEQKKKQLTMWVGHVVKPGLVRGYPPREWSEEGDLSSETESVWMKAEKKLLAGGLGGVTSHPSPLPA